MCELIQLQNSNCFTKKNKGIHFNLDQIGSWFINYNQYIQNKIKNKFLMKALNYACFKLEERAIGSVEKIILSML